MFFSAGGKNRNTAKAILGLASLILPTVLSENSTITVVNVVLNHSNYKIVDSVYLKSRNSLDVILFYSWFQNLTDLLDVNALKFEMEGVLDIAFFQQLQDDESYYSIGLGDHDGRMCCSRDAYERFVCTELGRLIVNDDFAGHRMGVILSSNGTIEEIETYTNDQGQSLINEGNYSMIFAPCNKSLQIRVSGPLGVIMVDESPTRLNIFFDIMSVAYITLLCYLGYQLSKERGNAVPQREIVSVGTALFVCVIGTIGAFLTSQRCTKYNENLPQMTMAMALTSALHEGLCWSLLALIGLGSSITNKLRRLMIVLMGLVYAGVMFVMMMRRISLFALRFFIFFISWISLILGACSDAGGVILLLVFVSCFLFAPILFVGGAISWKVSPDIIGVTIQKLFVSLMLGVFALDLSTEVQHDLDGIE